MRAFGGACARRKSHLRPFDSSSVTSLSGSASASGIPGAPPPEPTSTIDPGSARTSSSARSESSTSSLRMASRSRSAVSPGIASRPSIQRSSGEDDDIAVRLRTLARRLDALELLQAQVDDLALDRRHRLELDALAGAQHALGGAHGQRVQGGTPPLAVA